MRRSPSPRRGRLGVDVAGALNLLGSLVAPLGLAFAVPAGVAIGYGEPVWPFLVSGAVTTGSGLALLALTSGRERVGPREGYLVVALVWLAVAVFGSLPYLLAVDQLGRPVDAFFESMSGFSTTGASVVTDFDAINHSMAIWRQFSAWIGGLGIIVLFLAVLPRLNVAGRQVMFKTEAPGPEIGLETTIRDTARQFLTLYLALTAIAAGMLALLGWIGADDHMTPFRAVAHALTAVATAGFSTEARSIEPFAPVTQWAIAGFMLVAGTNFALLYASFVLRRRRVFRRDEEFRAYVVVVVAACGLVFVELVTEGILSGGEAARHAVFNTVSMLTTTGFASTDFNLWSPLAGLVLFGAVLVSASAGSTAGSIKLVRHVMIAKMLGRELRQTVHPELVQPLRLNRSVVDERTLRAIIVFLFLYVGVLAAGALAILVDSSLRGIELSAFEAFADSATVLGGVGPGLGFAGPMGSFEPFSDVSTLVLTAEMYLGRLEIVPVLVLFARSYWRA